MTKYTYHDINNVSSITRGFQGAVLRAAIEHNGLKKCNKNIEYGQSPATPKKITLREKLRRR